ncbi:hypothetical protein PoB_002315900 [Plakobranchus ocellatus]|uniref:Uncharacterized protein n=1 Tax=Plakobranchus ocellatus TaxID=259542 RepID=A0AAV3ZS07_9GAST|nr:hypothetical protein PoB_002315900 [Plakobranchus ocellatus]
MTTIPALRSVGTFCREFELRHRCLNLWRPERLRSSFCDYTKSLPLCLSLHKNLTRNFRDEKKKSNIGIAATHRDSSVITVVTVKLREAWREEGADIGSTVYNELAQRSARILPSWGQSPSAGSRPDGEPESLRPGYTAKICALSA